MSRRTVRVVTPSRAASSAPDHSRRVCNSDSSRSSSGNAELLFERLDELGELENGKSLNFFNKICNLLRNGMNLR